jgi:hypothetical protein
MFHDGQTKLSESSSAKRDLWRRQISVQRVCRRQDADNPYRILLRREERGKKREERREKKEEKKEERRAK